MRSWHERWRRVEKINEVKEEKQETGKRGWLRKTIGTVTKRELISKDSIGEKEGMKMGHERWETVKKVINDREQRPDEGANGYKNDECGKKWTTIKSQTVQERKERLRGTRDGGGRRR